MDADARTQLTTELLTQATVLRDAAARAKSPAAQQMLIGCNNTIAILVAAIQTPDALREIAAGLMSMNEDVLVALIANGATT